MPRRSLIRLSGSRWPRGRLVLVALLCGLILLPIAPALAVLTPLNARLTTPLDPALVTSHSVSLTDLTPDTNYTFQVKSCDAAGNCATSPPTTFQTLAQAPSTSTPTVATLTPVPSVTATVATGPQFSSQASASPPLVAPGQTSTITVTVTSASARSLLIDAEVYSTAGAQVFQQALDNQAFSAGQTRTFPFTWAVPSGMSAGSYTVKVGLFTPGWGPLLYWDDAAGTVTVGQASATSTAIPTSTALATMTPSPTPTATPTPVPDGEELNCKVTFNVLGKLVRILCD